MWPVERLVHMTTPVNPDQLRVSVEMGDDYQPSDRLRSALDELAAALADDGSDAEVSGFYYKYELKDFKVLSYDSTSPIGEQGSVVPMGETGSIDKTSPYVFKF